MNIDEPDKLPNYHFGFYPFGFLPWWWWGGWRWCNLGLLLRANKGCLFSIADLLSLSAALMPLCFNLINIQGDEDGCTDWYLYLLAQIDRQADKAIYSEKLSGGEVGESESESGGNQLQAFTLLISRYRAARDKGLPTNSILSLSTDTRKPFTSSIEIHNTQGPDFNSILWHLTILKFTFQSLSVMRVK